MLLCLPLARLGLQAGMPATGLAVQPASGAPATIQHLLAGKLWFLQERRRGAVAS
jgi:hypothetical protein